MESRRPGRRPSQVRPRPPVGSRPRPVRARPAAPSTTRLSAHKSIERGPGAPILLRLLLVVGVVALVGGVVWVGSGGVGIVAAGINGAVDGLVTKLSTTPSPTPSPTEAVSDAPAITKPDQPYTNEDIIDITVTVPTSLAGKPDHSVRLWLAPEEEQPQVVAEGSIGPTPTVILPDVPLVKGKNPFFATIVGPSNESEPSPVVTWIQDKTKPPIQITSPKDKAVVNGDVVTITGKTQGGSAIAARNEATGRTVTGAAKNDGTFSLKVPIVAGTNGITLTVTDVAANAASKVVTVRKGSGKLTVSLTADKYRFRATRLPADVQFTVTVVDPDGRPLADVSALFTITIPGLEPIVSPELTTAGDGTAVFQTRIARGATPGNGLASVLVQTDEYGKRTDRQVLTISP